MSTTDKSEPESSFFSRWSKRKEDARLGNATFEPAPATPPPVVPIEAKLPQTQPPADTSPTEATPLPTLESLTKDSDFSPFMQTGVAPEMRNLAMKKLFADPHYNVMDMLDTYVDDYSKPDPIPYSMLRAMNQSKALKLFEVEEAEEEAARVAAANAEVPVTALPAEPVTPVVEPPTPAPPVDSVGSESKPI